MRPSRTACISTQSDLLPLFYLQKPWLGIELNPITLLFILFLFDIICNLRRETVQVRVNAGVSGGVFNIERQAISPWRYTYSRYIPVVDGQYRLVDCLFCLEIDSRMEVVAP
jgi:hypothetical protein